jgi:serine/threonine protein kinase
MVTDESTTGSNSPNHYGMRGTLRWMAPELMCPEKFGFTNESRKLLLSRRTDIYAFGMTILEVRVLLHTCELKRFPTPLVGHHRTPSFQSHTHRTSCYVQRPRRGPTGQTVSWILRSIVGVTGDHLACRARIPTSKTPDGFCHNRSAERRCTWLAKHNYPTSDYRKRCVFSVHGIK